MHLPPPSRSRTPPTPTSRPRLTRLRLTNIQYDAMTISGTLELPDFNGRRAGYRFTPDRYPNLRPA